MADVSRIIGSLRQAVGAVAEDRVVGVRVVRLPRSSGGTSGQTSVSSHRQSSADRASGSMPVLSRRRRSSSATLMACVLLSPVSAATSAANRSTSAFLMVRATFISPLSMTMQAWYLQGGMQ